MLLYISLSTFSDQVVALLRQNETIAPDEVLEMGSYCRMVLAEVERSVLMDDAEFTLRVRRKQARFLRSKPVPMKIRDGWR